MKRLFHVSFEFDMVVLAEDEKEARQVAEDDCDDAFRDCRYGLYPFVDEIRDMSLLPSEWARSAPWGGDGSATCEQIMLAIEEAEKKRPPTAEEIEAAGQMRLLA